MDGVNTVIASAAVPTSNGRHTVRETPLVTIVRNWSRYNDSTKGRTDTAEVQYPLPSLCSAAAYGQSASAVALTLLRTAQYSEELQHSMPAYLYTSRSTARLCTGTV